MKLSEIAAAREAAGIGMPGAMITLFASATATAPQEDTFLDDFIADIRSGKWADPVSFYRAALHRGEKAQAVWLKRRLPAVTLSGTMTSRAKQAPVRTRTHSGWLQIDCDAEDNPQLVQAEARVYLAADPHIGAIFVGPSGAGIKCVLRIDPARHELSMDAAATYFLDRYGLVIDTNCRDQERLCFVSHDPPAWVRPSGCTIFPIPEAVVTAARERAARPVSASPLRPDIEQWTMDDVREILSYIQSCPEYHTWLRVASGVFSVLPMDAAIEVLEEWSPEEHPGEYAKKHRERLTRVTIRSVIHMAQACGFDARAAARRQRWLGRVILHGRSFPDSAPAPSAAAAAASPILHPDLLTEDPPEEEPIDPNELTGLAAWEYLENEQLGDAELFLKLAGTDYAFDYLSKCWRQFSPATGLWVQDYIGATSLAMSTTVTHAYETMVEMVREDMRETPGLRDTKDARAGEITKLNARCKSLRSSKYVAQVMDMAQRVPAANRAATSYDKHPHLLALTNGVLDFNGQLFRPHGDHSRHDLLSVSSPATYDLTSTCPTFDAFLTRAFDNDRDLIDYWWRIVGYSLTGYVHHDVLFFCHGDGSNGKSTALLTLRMLLGISLFGSIDVSTLLANDRGSNPTVDYQKATLEGKRLVMTDELPASRHLDESMVKKLIGGDQIPARRPYQMPYSFEPTHKIWMTGNHKPRIVGTDYGIWRRLHLIPWLIKIPPAEQRPRHELLATFRRELSGILISALHGYQDMQEREGLDPPRAVRVATEDYRQEEDNLAQFIQEQLCEKIGSNPIPTQHFFKRYDAWCKANGETCRASTSHKLTLLIQAPPYNLKVARGAKNAMAILNREWSDDDALLLSENGS